MIVALAGGVGGARLANGLASVVPDGELLIAVNVGDDFEHVGLTICPDIDTVTCTLAGLNDATRGWGMTGETWAFMDSLKALGGPDWFALGDKDLAKHVLRTHRLRQGESLSAITADFLRHYGVRHNIVPVSDDPVRTMIITDAGVLSFQDYFVRRRCEPRFLDARYEGAKAARALPALIDALHSPNLAAVVICPSNPVLSIGPMLAIPELSDALRDRRAPCVAVSPFIAGEAVKGPAAKIIRELGQTAGASTLLKMYDGLIDGIVCDEADPIRKGPVSDVRVIAIDTLMGDDAGQRRLARDTLAFAGTLR